LTVQRLKLVPARKFMTRNFARPLDSMLQDDLMFYSMGRESLSGAFSPTSGDGFSSRTNSKDDADSPLTSPSSPRVSRRSITEKHMARNVSEQGNATHRRSSLSRDDSFIDPRRKTVFAVADVEKARRPRCNSTSTIFVATTMCAPDRDGTITCVCTVIRAHLKEAQRRVVSPTAQQQNRNFQKFEENPSILPNPRGTMPSLKTLS
jgi:hypothetical protein